MVGPAWPQSGRQDPVRAGAGWLLNEVASAGRENLDAAHVARYDAKEDAAAEREVALLRSLGLDNRSVVVDLGGGTGQFAIAVSGSSGRVVAMDVYAVMLERLETNAAAAGATNIEIVHAGFLTYQHVGEPADFVSPAMPCTTFPTSGKPSRWLGSAG